MHLAIRINDTDLAEALRSYVGRRLRFALGRFGNRVRQVTVRIGGEGRSEVADGSLPRLPFGRVAVEKAIPICSRLLTVRRDGSATCSGASCNALAIPGWAGS
jgi:hypothetical protein